MPYRTGAWGEQAKLRSQNRKDYFKRRKQSNAIYSKQWAYELRKKVIAKFGGKCAICGFNDWRALQIDHVSGGGSLERKNMHQTTFYNLVLKDEIGKYQLLCANCNWIKRHLNKEITQRGGDFS